MRVGIVGAGLSGLLAGRALQAGGHDVVLFDKGRSPGGRLATRRIDGGTLDHGAQFFTVRDDRFAALVEEWTEIGLVQEWCRGFGPRPDGFPRYMARRGMNALAKHLAAGLDVRTRTLAFMLRPGAAGRWSLVLDDGTSEELDAAVVTCPLPQARSLTITAGVDLPPAFRDTDYDRTLALLAVLDRPGAVPPPGGVQDADETFSFVGDNQAKGVSAVPAITFHATPGWSLSWWDRPAEDTHAELRRRATPWLGEAEIVASEVKRWRFATPRAIWPDPCWAADGGAPLVFAGDAFAGPRVEGAALSGLAAAAALLS
jgi:predicted NAD/FAD-dependent oxidoreductase